MKGLPDDSDNFLTYNLILFFNMTIIIPQRDIIVESKLFNEAPVPYIFSLMLELKGASLDVSFMCLNSKIERVCFLLIKTNTTFLGKIRNYPIVKC